MRKREIVQVPAGFGRDAGKQFQITEMSAARAEKWAVRFIIALKGTTAAIPPELETLGMVGVAIRGINSFLAADVDFAKLEPLLDEMFECVQIVRDPAVRDRSSGEPIATPLVSPDDVEEIGTRAWLRSEVLRVHTNFSLHAFLSAWLERTMATTTSPAG